MQRNLTIILASIFFLNIIACTHTAPEEIESSVSEDHQVIGVSTWDRISVRSEPRRKSNTVTLLSLGESFTYLDSFAIDSAYRNTKFLKARLSDSSLVWVYDFAAVLNAEPAVMTHMVPLYLRPDLLTITGENLNVMEIVAVVEEWDNWIKIVNEKNEKVGWIKKELVSYNTIDLALALLAKRKLEEQDTEQKIKNLEELIDNNPYSNSIFVAELQKRLEAEKDSLRKSNESWHWEDQNRKRRD